jgi:outer membrane protein OmpA-like peptidoglycan-associated protein
MRRIVTVGILLPLAGCVEPYQGPLVALQQPAPYGRGPVMMTQDQTAGIEEQDRITRFYRLARLQGIQPPHIDEITVPPGSVDTTMSSAVPVVRVVFPESVFFAFGSDLPLPASGPILDVIAENMRNDVADAKLTVLGHTDFIGSDEYNIDLSRRRAEAVMRALVARGVRPGQVSEVAIGKRQPIADNNTAEGRALNRRVEFLISPALAANLAAVLQRIVPRNYLESQTHAQDPVVAYGFKPQEKTSPVKSALVLPAPIPQVEATPGLPSDATPVAPGATVLAPIANLKVNIGPPLLTEPGPLRAPDGVAVSSPADIKPARPMPSAVLPLQPSIVEPSPLNPKAVPY